MNNRPLALRNTFSHTFHADHVVNFLKELCKWKSTKGAVDQR